MFNTAKQDSLATTENMVAKPQLLINISPMLQSAEA